MQTATMTLTERATLLQEKLAEDGVPVTHEEATNLLIADWLERQHC
jgi:hypothetical protein